MHNIPKPIWK